MTESNSRAALPLDGESLTIQGLVEAARFAGVRVAPAPGARERVTAAHTVVLDVVDRGVPVYGLTTGLGSRVDQILSAEQIADFSLQTLRGRAHAIGEPMPVKLVRAAMIVRVNTLLKGAAGASPDLVDFLILCLEKDLVPIVGSIGSIGASDLCLGATLGLALVGEGKMRKPDGEIIDAMQTLSAVGLQPIKLAPRDGLALANHSSFSAAAMAICVYEARQLVEACQCAAALSMAGFQANLSPLDPLASRMRPQAGQDEAAQQLLSLLDGSSILDTSNARRLQDPLSIRNVCQTHGAVLATLAFASAAATDEINGASDNPVVDIEQGRIVSCGAYHTPLLAIASQGLAQSLVHLAHTQLARIARLLGARFTDLPQFLAATTEAGSAASNGFAPVLKVAETLVARIAQSTAPVAIWPSVNAEGAEDIQTHAMTAIQGLQAAIEDLQCLCAIEFMVAAQAIDLRKEAQPEYVIGNQIELIHNRVRKLSDRLHKDRPLAGDIEAIARDIDGGGFRIR